MNKIFLALLGLCLHCTAQAQLYNGGSTISVAASTTLHIGGDFTNATNGVIANNGSINLSGNLVNNQSMPSANSGTLTFAGSSAQTVSGSANYLAKNVTFNNAAGVTISKALKADGEVGFQAGVVAASSSSEPLVFTANGTVSTTNAPSNTSHVNGYVVKEGIGAFTYPVGDGTRYQQVGTILTANSTGMRAKYNAMDAGSATLTTPLLAYNTLEYWDLSPLSSATGSVIIYWDDYNSGAITNITHLVVAHRLNSSWISEIADSVSGNTSAGSVTSQAISTWSPFALGSISLSSPLPISLASASANVSGQNATLSWVTAQETNNDRFVIERQTPQGWKQVGEVQGKGTTTQESRYSFTVPKLDYGKHTFRLVEHDFDGTKTYSSLIEVFIELQDQFFLSEAYPNPFNPSATFTFAVALDQNVQIALYDITGRKIQTLHNGTLAAQTTHAFTIDGSALASGRYFVQVKGENFATSKGLVLAK